MLNLQLLVRLPTKISECDEVIQFMTPTAEDINPPKEDGSVKIIFFLSPLRPSHTAAITKTTWITMQRECILSVELLLEYAHA